MNDATAAPTGAQRVFATVLRVVDRVIDTVVLSLLSVMVLVVCWQVFTRYALGYTPRWASETALVLMGWVGFLGIAYGIRERSHIELTYVVDRLPTRIGRVVSLLGPMLMLVFGGYLVVQGWDFTVLMADSTLPSTGLPRAVQYAAVPVSGLLVILYSLLQLFRLGTTRTTEIDDGDN